MTATNNRQYRKTHNNHKPLESRRHRENLRRQICYEAARLLAIGEARSVTAAKEKALSHLGLSKNTALPTNEEIEAALTDYTALFQAPETSAHLKKLREIALESMNFLGEFNPRLVGAVLKGAVTQDTKIELHVFVENLESFVFWLNEQRIPHEQREKVVRYKSGVKKIPSVSFLANSVTIELALFHPLGLREAPLDPANGRPYRRAPLKIVEKLT